MGLLKSSCLELAEVRVEGGKGHQRHGWVLESLVRHQGRPKGTSTGGGDPPRDGNALSERDYRSNQSNEDTKIPGYASHTESSMSRLTTKDLV